MTKKIILCIFLIEAFLSIITCRKKSTQQKVFHGLYIYQGSCLNASMEILPSKTCIFLYIKSPLQDFIRKTYKPILVSNDNILVSELDEILSKETSTEMLYMSSIDSIDLEKIHFASETIFFHFENNESLLMKTSNQDGNVLYNEIYILNTLENEEMNEIHRFLQGTNSSNSTNATCGNGIREPPEECDDGNTISGDGCSSTCQIETFYDCSQKNGTYCFDKRPPYCLLTIPDNHFYLSVQFYLTFSKVMQPIDFKNASVAKLSVDNLTAEQDFVWNYTMNDNKTYAFNVIFKTSFQSKSFKVKFINPNNILDMSNIPITSISYAPSGIINEFIYYTQTQIDFFNVIDMTLSYLMIALLFVFFPLLILDSLSIFWLYIEMLQTLNLILYVNIDIPDNAVVFFRALSPANFIKFEYLDIFNFNSLITYHENDSLPYAFREEKFSTGFIHNCFFALLFYAIVIAIFLMIKIFNKLLVAPLSEKKSCSLLVNINGYLQDLMEYSAILRVALITFIPLTMAAILQMINFRFDANGNILNSLLALFCIIYICCFSLYTIWFLNSSSTEYLEDPEIDKKFLPLFDLLKKKAFFKRNFTVFYMLRKFFWIISLVFLDDLLLDQIFILIFWSLFITTFMYFKKPYEVDKINLLTLFTELMILAILLLIGTIQCLSDLQDNFLSVDQKLIIGWVILSIGLLLVLVKALSMIIEILVNVKSLVSNTKFLFKNINNNERMSISAEGDNLIDPSYSGRDGDVQAIKEVDEEEEYDEEKEKEKENLKL